MPSCSTRQPRAPTASSTLLVLREARRLHRAAASDSPSISLPVLRRVLAAGAAPTRTLPNLFRARNTVQRKHVLRTLAVEAGYGSWEEYARALPLLDMQQLQLALHAERGASRLKLWFASEAEAAQFASEHGGQAVRVGKQAVVLPQPRVESAQAVR